MKSETRTFRLTVLSPVHVGCGNVYEPTSFVVKEDKEVLVAFDPLHFLESLSEEKLGKFSAFCKQGTVESLLDIYKFINLEGRDIEGVEVGIGSEFLQHYRSVLSLDRRQIRNNLNKFEINRTAYNPLDGQVYIPGSAVKGSLRTAVLNGRHKENPQQGKFTYRGGSRELQEKILDGGKFATDPFSRVKVSDFRSVAEVSRRVVYGVDEKKKPGPKDASAVYQIFEVVEPGTVFEGSVTIQVPDRQAGIRTPVTFAEMEEALSGFYGKACAREASEASVIGAKHDIQAGSGSMLMRVGRHSGAECVTIAGKRNIRIMAGKGKPPKTLDRATTIWFASDTKKPKNKDGLRPFGWVTLHPASQEEIREGVKFDRQERERLAARRQAALQRRQETVKLQEERLERQRLAEAERRRVEEEARQYPWRPWLRTLQDIRDWGMFRQLILDNEEAAAWRKKEEVGVAVVEAAERVRKARPDKWTSDRDELTADWLEPTGVTWGGSTGDEEVHEETSVSPLVARIEALTEWGRFKEAPVAFIDLDKEAVKALQKKFKEWGCNGKKAKSDKKKAWKALQARLRQLS